MGSSTFSNGIMFYESGLLGTIFIISLSYLLDKGSSLFIIKPVIYMGRFSLYFMCVHNFIRYILYLAFERIGISQSLINYEWLYSAIFYIILLGFSFITVFLINLVGKKISDSRGLKRHN